MNEQPHAIEHYATFIQELTEPQQPASSLQTVKESSVFVKRKMNYWEVMWSIVEIKGLKTLINHSEGMW